MVYHRPFQHNLAARKRYGRVSLQWVPRNSGRLQFGNLTRRHNFVHQQGPMCGLCSTRGKWRDRSRRPRGEDIPYFPPCLRLFAWKDKHSDKEVVEKDTRGSVLTANGFQTSDISVISTEHHRKYKYFENGVMGIGCTFLVLIYHPHFILSWPSNWCETEILDGIKLLYHQIVKHSNIFTSRDQQTNFRTAVMRHN